MHPIGKSVFGVTELSNRSFNPEVRRYHIGVVKEEQAVFQLHGRRHKENNQNAAKIGRKAG